MINKTSLSIVINKTSLSIDINKTSLSIVINKTSLSIKHHYQSNIIGFDDGCSGGLFEGMRDGLDDG